MRTTLASKKPYAVVLAAFRAAVAGNGMKVMDSYDQETHLGPAGLPVKGTLYLVGNPNVGKQAFARDPAVGLYLPSRVYIYQGNDGMTHLSYDRPSLLLQQFHDPEITRIGKMLDQKLDTVVHAAAQ